MNRTRVVIVAVVAAGVMIGGVIALSSGGDVGPRTFLARDTEAALLVEWTRVDDDVSGSLTFAHLMRPTPGIFNTAAVTYQTPRMLQRENSAFTGTVSDHSVRLRFASGPFGSQLNGKLDGDTLKLVFPRDSADQTLTLKRSTRATFDDAATQLRAAEARRINKIRTTHQQADAAARRAITRVATAYVKALDPRSPDDPCRYVTAAAEAKLRHDATAATKPGGCKAVVRFNEREQQGGLPPQRLGAAEVVLGQPVRVPGASSGRLADGAELRFAAIPNHLITVVREGGHWRIAAPAGTV